MMPPDVGPMTESPIAGGPRHWPAMLAGWLLGRRSRRDEASVSLEPVARFRNICISREAGAGGDEAQHDTGGLSPASHTRFSAHARPNRLEGDATEDRRPFERMGRFGCARSGTVSATVGRSLLLWKWW